MQAKAAGGKATLPVTVAGGDTALPADAPGNDAALPPELFCKSLISTSELGLQVYPAAPALKQAEAPQLASRLVPARRRSCVQPACLSQWEVRIPATNQQ